MSLRRLGGRGLRDRLVRSVLRRGYLSLMVAVLMAIPTWPQQKPTDLSDKSIEDLMNIEVTSVSKREEKLSRTASAIFVITQDDILRSGATSIPDLLRMVPGLDVAQIDGSTWAIMGRADSPTREYRPHRSNSGARRKCLGCQCRQRGH